MQILKQRTEWGAEGIQIPKGRGERGGGKGYVWKLNGSGMLTG